jgi:hypothetical protein
MPDHDKEKELARKGRATSPAFGDHGAAIIDASGLPDVPIAEVAAHAALAATAAHAASTAEIMAPVMTPDAPLPATAGAPPSVADGSASLSGNPKSIRARIRLQEEERQRIENAKKKERSGDC